MRKAIEAALLDVDTLLGTDRGPRIKVVARSAEILDLVVKAYDKKIQELEYESLPVLSEDDVQDWEDKTDELPQPLATESPPPEVEEPEQSAPAVSTAPVAPAAPAAAPTPRPPPRRRQAQSPPSALPGAPKVRRRSDVVINARKKR